MIRILFAGVHKPQLQLSTRHTKGISTLFLLILAESLSLSNAVNLWSIYDSYHYRHEGAEAFSTRNQKPNQFARAYRKAEECLEPRPSTSSSKLSNCPLPPSLPPTRLFPGTRLAIRVTSPHVVRKSPDGECRVECAKCTNPPDIVQNGSYIPRGGHSVVAPAPRDLLDAATTTAAAAAGFAELTPYGIPLTGWKVIFQIILTAINVFCWLVPLRSKKMSENKFALSLANAFSGGVFLSLAFGHLIPECIHGFEGFNEVTPYMLVLAGYLLIFFVEKVAFDAHDILHEMEHSYEKANGAASKGEHEVGEKAGAHSSGRSAQILLGALAIHSILEMMALGLADSFGDCALLTLSIALHQPAESIALLVAFLKSGMPKAEIVQFLSIFSAMGPIGVALGIAVNQFAAPIVDAIMLAIVAGTFVYVGATEVIPEEFEDSENKWMKFCALISGIVSIFLITQYTMSLGA